MSVGFELSIYLGAAMQVVAPRGHAVMFRSDGQSFAATIKVNGA